MSEIMTYEQIKQTYDGEWVLIAYKEVNDDLQVVEGEVIAHSPNREEIYSLLATVEEQPLAIEYLGQISEDLAFVI